MSKIKIYSASVCPFAHRTRLALLEKNVEFDLQEIDLSDKPDWFAQVSPHGKVPVIQHDEHRVWESAVINEYLEEVFPEPAMLPQDPGQRAFARIWIDFANTKFIGSFYKLLMNQDVEEQKKWAQDFSENLLFMEQEGISKTPGPYWLGNDISLVDVTFYPWFERFAVVEHYRKFFVPEECEHLKQWSKKMAERDSVKSIANSAEYYLQQYSRYASGVVSEKTIRDLQRNR